MEQIPFIDIRADVRALRAELTAQAASERATTEPKAHEARCSVATGSASSCCYCGGTHEADKCLTTYTPINDCEHKDAVDGCCLHPKNMTPECHVGACPRLHRRIFDAWHASLPNT